MAVLLETSQACAPGPERRAWESLCVKLTRRRCTALRRAFALADRLEPLWDDVKRAVEAPRA